MIDASFDICFVMRLETRRHWIAMEAPVHQKAAQEVFLPLSQKILFYDFTSNNHRSTENRTHPTFLTTPMNSLANESSSPVGAREIGGAIPIASTRRSNRDRNGTLRTDGKTDNTSYRQMPRRPRHNKVINEILNRFHGIDIIVHNVGGSSAPAADLYRDRRNLAAKHQ